MNVVQSRAGAALHQVPVEEPLEAPVEVELRAGAQEAVRLGRHVTDSNVLPSRRSSATSSSDWAGLTRSSRSPCAMSSGARTRRLLVAVGLELAVLSRACA